MRKRLIDPVRHDSAPHDERWLDLDAVADVEFTSEEPGHPIECALVPGHAEGWIAASPGEQTIRLAFNPPQRLSRISLRFSETRLERTQEYALRWSSDGGNSFREIVRQRWTFSPDGSTAEIESHAVELSGVTTLELRIVPDINGGSVRASLEELRLA